MKKLSSLKTHLVEQIPGLRNNPDRINVWADEGSVSFAIDDDKKSFAYRFNAIVLLTDISDHLDFVFYPLIDWLRKNERSIDPEKIKWLSSPLDGKKSDIRITLPLTQPVLVDDNGDGTVNTTHPDEPAPDWLKQFGNLNEVNPRDRSE